MTGLKIVSDVILPRVMSELLEIGLRDIEAVEKARSEGVAIKVDMGTWHRGGNNQTLCAVCFAGGTMRQTLGAPDTEWLYPDDFPGNEDQLSAMDDLRTGNLVRAFALLNKDMEDAAMALHEARLETLSRPITWYEENPEEFKAGIRDLIEDCRAAGY